MFFSPLPDLVSMLQATHCLCRGFDLQDPSKKPRLHHCVGLIFFVGPYDRAYTAYRVIETRLSDSGDIPFKQYQKYV